MKKTLSLMMALVFALAFFVSAAGAIEWNTSTVGLKVVPDIESVAGNRTLNLGIMGLDDLGNVDILGESGGSTIIAGVTSLLGNPLNVTVGGITNTTPGGALPGSFAASTRYYTLAQGNGLCNITYPADASGDDSVTVVLYESRTDAGFNTMTREIARKVLTVPVVAVQAAVGILDIESFTPAAVDANGVPAVSGLTLGPLNEANDNGLGIAPAPVAQAKMTVGVAGGEFVVRAYAIGANRNYTANGTLSGTVTLTLTGNARAVEGDGNNRATAADVYTFTGTMANGVATVVVDNTVIKAGVYKAVATMDAWSSIPKKISDSAAGIDDIDVAPLATVAATGLSSNMPVVSVTAASQATVPTVGAGTVDFDPSFTVFLLDKYGNKVFAAGTPATTVKVTDANYKIADFNVLVPPNSNSAASLQDGNTFTPGMAVLTASVPASPTVAASAPVNQKIVPANAQLVVDDVFTAPLASPVTAGAVLTDFLDIGTDTTAQDGKAVAVELNTLLATDRITITRMAPLKADGTLESVTVAVKNTATPNSIDALFLYANATPTTTYRIDDAGGSYASLFVTPAVAMTVVPASPSKAYVKNAYGEQITEVPASEVAGSYTMNLDGGRVSLTDAYGNTPLAAALGTLSLVSSVGVATNGPITPGNAATGQLMTYPLTVSADDPLTFNFTQPGISSVNDGNGLTVTFPAVGALDHFATFTGASVMPINGIVPLTIIPQSAANKTVNQASGYYIDYDTAGLALQTAAGVPYASGANVGSPSGRLCFRVIGKTTPGTYDITIRNAAGTVTKTVSIEVKEYTLPLAVSESAADLDIGDTADVTVSGGSPVYTVASADPAIATATITGSTVTITGVAAGTVDVTVTDAAGDTAVIAVTVASGVVPPADGFPSAAMTPVDFPATVDPAAEAVTVAAGPVALTPTMTVANCSDVVSAIGYVWVPSANFGTAIPATVTCAGGVASFDLGTIDFSAYPGTYDFYYGYVDNSGDIHYNAYELTVN